MLVVGSGEAVDVVSIVSVGVNVAVSDGVNVQRLSPPLPVLRLRNFPGKAIA